MEIIRFSDKINEVLIHPDFDVKDDIETYGIISFDKYIYMFDEDNQEQITAIIDIINDKFNNEYDRDYIENDGDADFLYRVIEENYPNILTFKYTIGNDTLYFSFDNDFTQNPESSKQYIDVLKTLKNKFDIKYLSVIDKDGNDDTFDINSLILNWNEDIKYKKLPSYVYHGTCLKYLKKILKMGLRPNVSPSNYGKIIHTDKIFFSANLKYASYHAENTATKNNSIPIILKIDTSVFDINKIDLDYDFYKTFMDDNKHPTYSKISSSESGHLLIKLKNKYIGATYNKFAYTGYILPKYIVALIVKSTSDDELYDHEYSQKDFKDFLEMVDFYEEIDTLEPDNYNFYYQDYIQTKNEFEFEKENEFEEELEEIQETKANSGMRMVSATVDTCLDTLNPLMIKYFDSVQNTMKKILILKPYNIPEDELNDFMVSFFKNATSKDKLIIRDIIDKCFNENLDYHKCAYALLSALYKKYNINKTTSDKLPNNSYVIEKFNHKLNEEIIEKIYDGENGFLILLSILSENNIIFYKPNDKRYLNTGDYKLFLYTNILNSYHELLIDLKSKKSLAKTANTLEYNSKKQNLSFYFAIKNNEIIYGLYDIFNHQTYPSGKFNISSKIFNKIANYNSCLTIRNILNSTNLNNINLLNKIKTDLKEYLKDDKQILILNDKVISKVFNYSDFKNPYLAHDKFLSHFENWILKFKWNTKVHYYVELDNENIIYYIKIKDTSEI